MGVDSHTRILELIIQLFLRVMKIALLERLRRYPSGNIIDKGLIEILQLHDVGFIAPTDDVLRRRPKLLLFHHLPIEAENWNSQ